jgi:hypothetical protein
MSRLVKAICIAGVFIAGAINEYAAVSHNNWAIAFSMLMACACAFIAS